MNHTKKTWLLNYNASKLTDCNCVSAWASMGNLLE